MIRLIVDAAMKAKLKAAGGRSETCTESGELIGYFEPALAADELKSTSPFADEEIERRRQNHTGRPLKDLLRDLESAWSIRSSGPATQRRISRKPE